jgi:hypothetical protein
VSDTTERFDPDYVAWTITIQPSGLCRIARADLHGLTDLLPPPVGTEIGPLAAADHEGRPYRVPVAVVTAWTDHRLNTLASVRYEVRAVVKGEFGPAPRSHTEPTVAPSVTTDEV